MLNLKPHEETFEVKPVGIRYRCELCDEGEMILNETEPVVVEMSYPPKSPLRRHVCNKCGGVLMLPKAYPYIEWVPVEEEKPEYRDGGWYFKGTYLNKVTLLAKIIVEVLPFISVTTQTIQNIVSCTDEIASDIINELMDLDILYRDDKGFIIVKADCLLHVSDQAKSILNSVGITDEQIRQIFVKKRSGSSAVKSGEVHLVGEQCQGNES